MAVPELDVARVRRWCAERVPEHARHQVRVECQVAARHLTVVERRAPWAEDVGHEWSSFTIARLRYTATDSAKLILHADANIGDPIGPRHAGLNCRACSNARLP
jgi:hypothetical protein